MKKKVARYLNNIEDKVLVEYLKKRKLKEIVFYDPKEYKDSTQLKKDFIVSTRKGSISKEESIELLKVMVEYFNTFEPLPSDIKECNFPQTKIIGWRFTPEVVLNMRDNIIELHHPEEDSFVKEHFDYNEICRFMDYVDSHTGLFKELVDKTSAQYYLMRMRVKDILHTQITFAIDKKEREKVWKKKRIE